MSENENKIVNALDHVGCAVLLAAALLALTIWQAAEMIAKALP